VLDNRQRTAVKERERLKQLLPKNETLIQASTWPDQIRKAIPQANPLHYVDVPRGSNYYDTDRDCPQRICIVEAINWYVQVLRSREAPLAEKRSSDHLPPSWLWS
jgi:hypothetical protein